VKEIDVALSGTLETFSLPDVLRLLSSTKKTGLLALDGDRGRGRMWVRDGAIVAADADRATNEQLEGVAFELLRFVDASFEFDSGVEPAVDGEAHEVDDVLAEAESRLAEWREIEAVVPSLDVWVRMVDELDDDRTVTAQQWRVLAQVGTGASGHALAERLQQGEYDVCRQLRDLVEEGMVELTEASIEHAAPAMASPVLGVDVDAAWDRTAEPTFVEPVLDPDAVTSLGADLASFVADGTVDEAVPVDFSELAPAVEPDEDQEHQEPAGETTSFEAIADTGEAPPEDDRVEGEEPDEADDDEDFLSQLSQLSPKAAAAVEATWSVDAPADDAEEQPTADAAPAAAGDDIDQNLLLRFLSSAKG
jgi:Domain of unknown function (DUF4388)